MAETSGPRTSPAPGSQTSRTSQTSQTSRTSLDAGAADATQPRMGRALLALLRGQEPTAAGAVPLPQDERARLEERGDDLEARERLALHAFLAQLPGRVARARGLESAPVVLADGSALTLDDAERLLARKEERRAHPALRALVDAAAWPFQQAHGHEREAAHADGSHADGSHADGSSGAAPWGASWDAPWGAPWGDLQPDHVEVLRGVLARTRDLRDAARAALSALCGEDPTGPALARALDLPDDTGAFGEASTLAVLRAAREAASPHLATAPVAVTRFSAPRQLAGAVVHDGETLRFAQPPSMLRFRRHWLTLTAGARAMSWAISENLAGALAGARARARAGALAVGARSGSVADVAHAHGAALALGLCDAAVRRHLGAARADAERTDRIAAACLVLEVRARAAVAACPDLDAAITARERLDVTRGLLEDALGADAPASLVAEALAPPWLRVATVRGHAAREALGWLEAVAVADGLRMRADSAFALSRDAWRPEMVIEVAEVTADTAERAARQRAGAVPDAGPRAEADAQASVGAALLLGFVGSRL